MNNRSLRQAAAIWAAIAVFAALSASVRAAAAEPIASVPFRFAYGGVLTARVTIDGAGPYDFIIDTGATISVVFENLAEDLALEPTQEKPRRLLGISGSQVLDVYRLGDIALGAAVKSDHLGVVIPDWQPPRQTPQGVLGADFLRRYAIVFDVGKQTMTLYPPGEIPPADKKRLKKVRLRARSYAAASGELFVTRGKVNNAQANFIIDTGAAATIINYEAAEGIYESTVSGNLGEGMSSDSRLTDLFDDRVTPRTALIHRIRVGRTAWRRVGVWVYNAPIFDEINVQRRPFGLLGADLIAAQDFALDLSENALYLARPARTGQRSEDGALR